MNQQHQKNPTSLILLYLFWLLMNRVIKDSLRASHFVVLFNQSYHLFTGDPAAQPFTLSQGKALAMTAIDVFTNPELLQRIKDDFAKDLQTRK